MNENPKQLKKLIEELWNRARINAFAHREAANEYRNKDTLWFMLAISLSLFSILFITLSYIFSQNQSSDSFVEYLPLFFVILSTISAFVSLGFTIFNNHMRYSILCEQHKFIQNSYMQIAQRTRAIKNPSNNDLNALYCELERAFADIKVRGIEPQDGHFNKAHEIVGRREKDDTSSKTLSFQSKVEPQDKHFDKAHKIVERGEKGETSSKALSFQSK